MGGPEREGKKENGKNEMRRKGDVTRTPLSFMKIAATEWHISYTTSYWSAILTMSFLYPFHVIFNVEDFEDLKIL